MILRPSIPEVFRTIKELENEISRSKRQRESVQADLWRWDDRIDVLEKRLKRRKAKS